MAITGKRKRYIIILLALAVCFFLSSVFTLTIGASAEKGRERDLPFPFRRAVRIYSAIWTYRNLYFCRV